MYVGGGLASLSILLDSVIGWRNTLFVIGGIGVAVAVLCRFLVEEPRSTGAIALPPVSTIVPESTVVESNGGVTEIITSAFTGLQQVVKSDEAKFLLSASVLRFCAGFSIAIWKAPFVFAKFPDNASSFAGKIFIVYCC